MASGQQDLLSLCVIARDEAHNLPRLLASVTPWVGEIVVVDTGSVDDTVNVATAWGARVVHRPWENSFSLARNHSLETATRPWALVLDADEELVVTDAKAFADTLQGETQALAVDCHDLRDDGSYAVAPLLRLFRRDNPHLRFEGAVHEQLVGVARGQIGVAHARFMHFRHDGHTATVLKERNKDERNLTLARAQVNDAAEDPFAWFCLGQALLTQPTTFRQEQAVVAFAQAVARLGNSQEGEAFVVALFASYAHSLVQLGRHDEALAALCAALATFPHSADLRLLRGNLLISVMQLAQAEEDLRICLSPAAEAFFVRLNPNACGYEARVALGICLLKQGRVGEAKTMLQDAVNGAPANDSRARTLLEIVIRR